jgi:prefoldin alpha subunit
MPEEKRDADREMQEKVLAYRMLDSRLKGLAQQRELITQKILEIRTTIASIEEAVKREGDVLFSLGSEARVHGNIKDKKNIIVEIGAGVALEKSVNDAKATLENRIKELETALSNVQTELGRVSSAMSDIQSKLENR